MAAEVEIPLGKMEDQHLEFKSAAALEQLEKIAREVVAMLNAEGGEVWIGLREEGGRAMEIEPIRDAQSAKSRLVDFLVDTMDPSPDADEMRVEVVPLPEGRDSEQFLIRIKLTNTPSRKPYAVVRGTTWSFPRRVGARLVPMAREEIAEAMRKGGSDEEQLDRARKQLLEWRDVARQTGLEGLWLGLLPVPELALDLQSERFKELATVPRASGNRSAGWNFASAFQPSLTAHSFRWGGKGQPPKFELRAEILDDGRAQFFATFRALSRGEDSIYPFTVLEYPISAIRIASHVYRDQATDFRVLADLSLFRVGKWKLPPGTPGEAGFVFNDPVPLQEGDDAVFRRPLEFSRSEFVDEPDRCGFRLVRRIYQAFGLREDDIPRHYDREAGRLVFPE